jgi:hypothetical protein
MLTGAAVEARSSSVSSEIVKALDDLIATGSYWEPRRGPAAALDDTTRELFSSIAAEIKKSASNPVRIPIDDLSRALHTREPFASNSNILLDITGLPKILAAQVTSICVAENHHVGLFNLRVDPDEMKPHQLIYGLLEPGDFEYVPLNREPAVQATVAKFVPVQSVKIATLIVLAIGLVSLGVLTVIAPDNLVLSLVALTANVLGILGAVAQFPERR